MEAGKIIGGILAGAAVGAGIYFGFVKKAEDGTTWIQRQTKPKEEDKKVELQTPASDPVNNHNSKPPKKVVPKADPIPAAPFKKGATVMAAQDMALFTQPSAEARFTKANAVRFDILGTFDSTAAAYPGWSKIYVTKTLKKSGVMVPNKWMAYVKTNMLTKPVQ